MESREEEKQWPTSKGRDRKGRKREGRGRVEREKKGEQPALTIKYRYRAPGQ